MPKIQHVKIIKKKSASGDPIYKVVGAGIAPVETFSLKQARISAGARKRMIIKRALREVGITRMPRSLMKPACGIPVKKGK